MVSEMFLSQATSTDRRGKRGLPRPFAVWNGDVEIALCILAAVESLWKFGQRPKRSGNRSWKRKRHAFCGVKLPVKPLQLNIG